MPNSFTSDIGIHLFTKFFLLIVAAFALLMSIALIVTISLASNEIESRVDAYAQTSFDVITNRVQKVFDRIENIETHLADDVNNILKDKSNMDLYYQMGTTALNADIGAACVGTILEPKYNTNDSCCWNNYTTASTNVLDRAVLSPNSNELEFLYNSEWYRYAASANAKPFWTHPYNDSSISGNPFTCSYIIPLYDLNVNTGERNFAGIFRISVAISYFSKLLANYSIGYSSFGILLDEEGKITSFPLQQYNGKPFSILCKDEDLLDTISTLKVNMLGGTKILDVDSLITPDNHSTVMIRKIPKSNWTLVVAVSNTIYGDTINNVMYYFILVSIILFVLTAIAVYIIVHHLLLPLSALFRSLTEADKTDYLSWNMLESKTNDELNVITNAINKIVSGLNIQNSKYNDLQVNCGQLEKKLEDEKADFATAVEEQTQMLSSQNKLLDMALGNMTSLTSLGRTITSSLSLETICNAVYERISKLIPLNYFGILVYDDNENLLKCDVSILNGEQIPPYSISTLENTTLSAKCFAIKSPIMINNFEYEYRQYVVMGNYSSPIGKIMPSMYFCPISSDNEVKGLFTLQSQHIGVFNDINFDILQSLKMYLDISINNVLSYEQLQRSMATLNATQNKLVQSERMASLGQLTAGVAHEIKNPLNFVINFSELSKMLVGDIREELERFKKDKSEDAINEIEDLMKDMELNISKINEHSHRADNIVKGMLQHSRGKVGEYQMTDPNDIVQEYSKLAYHGLRATDPLFSVEIEYHLDESIGNVNIVPHNISRVIINIVGNGCFAAYEKLKTMDKGTDFVPTVTITTLNEANDFIIKIRDNGIGISEENKAKIFTPFFTTKASGQGTGLGLSICYDIVVQEHKGEITFDSEEGEWTEFVIKIPKSLK